MRQFQRLTPQAPLVLIKKNNISLSMILLDDMIWNHCREASCIQLNYFVVIASNLFISSWPHRYCSHIQLALWVFLPWPQTILLFAFGESLSYSGQIWVSLQIEHRLKTSIFQALILTKDTIDLNISENQIHKPFCCYFNKLFGQITFNNRYKDGRRIAYRVATSPRKHNIKYGCLCP